MAASARFVIYDRISSSRRGEGVTAGGRALFCRRWATAQGHDVLAGAVYVDIAPAGKPTTTLNHAIDTCLRFGAQLLVYDVDVLAELPLELPERLHAEHIAIWSATTGEPVPRVGVVAPAPAGDALIAMRQAS